MTKSKELLINVLALFFTMILLWFGLVFLVIGREVYGKDVALIFAGGMIFVFYLERLTEFFIKHYQESQK